MASIPHLKVPFTLLPDMTAATVQQDTLEEITQCVFVLMATPIGSRIEVPTYGIPDLTFTGGQLAAIDAAAARWEPRANVTAKQTINPQNPRETDITVSVQVAQ